MNLPLQLDRPTELRETQSIAHAVTVVMINYRTPAMTIDALQSIADTREDLAVDCVVVDNASGDDSGRVIERAIGDNGWSWCKLILAESNDGFSAGNNLGASASDGAPILLLNSDTLVGAKAIQRLLAALESNRQIGITSPRLQWPSGESQVSCFRYFRPTSEFVRSASIGWVTKRLPWAEVAMPLGQDDRHESQAVDWTSFACVLIRRDVFDRLGGMDEGYFMYFDDVDFCRQVNGLGYDIVHCPEASVIHFRGGSSSVKRLQSARKKRPRYYYAARTRYYAKHFGRSGLLLANLLWMTGGAFAKAKALLTRRPTPHCKAEWRDIWINFLRPMNGRNR